MADTEQSGQETIPASGKFDNLLKAFDIKDVENAKDGDQSADSTKSPAATKSKQHNDERENNGVHVGAGDSTKEDLAAVGSVSSAKAVLNTSMTSTASSESPGRLRIDESRSDAEIKTTKANTTKANTTKANTAKVATTKAATTKAATTKAATTKAATTKAATAKASGPPKKKDAPVKKTRKVSTNPLPPPVVSIKEEKEDYGYNNAMKNVITMITPSPVVTTSVPVTSISLLTGSSMLGKSILSTPPSQAGRPAKSLVSPSQLKIAPRPNPQVVANPTKFAIIPASTSNPRSQTSRTVTLYVPPNLLTTSGVGGAIRLPTPQSLMELLSRSGQAITSKSMARPAVTVVQSSQSMNQAGLINPNPRISSQVAATRQPVAAAPRMPAASGPVTLTPASAASRDALVKMLRRDPVPIRRITMPPVELNFGTVTKHICACGDEFLYAANLECHIARKSAIITVMCQYCTFRRNQVFYNPCALTFHMHSHKKTLTEFLKGVISLQVVPIGKKTVTEAPSGDCIDLSKEPEMPNITKESNKVNKVAEKEPINIDEDKETESEQRDNGTSKTTNSSSIEVSPEKPQSEMNDDEMLSPTVPPPEREESRYDSCPYCKVLLEKGTALEHHFQTAQQNHSDEQVHEYICSVCNRQLPNPCSYQAHQAFHNKQRPFICPECGETINGSIDTYVKHVQDKCMHNVHFLRFGCTKCPKKKKKFSTRKQLLEHIENHGETYVKCLHCPMAFRSMETLKDHCSKTHTISDVTDTDYKSIFKCALCDTVYQEAEQRRTHLATHNKDLRVFLVYRCNKMNCGANRIFITKVRIREHLATAHGLDVLIHLCNVCGTHFDTADLLTEHLKSHPNPDECALCGEVCSDQETLWKHLTHSHDNQVQQAVSEPPRPRSPAIIRKRTSSETPLSPAAKRVKSPPYVPSCQVEAAEDSRFYCSDCKLKFLRQGVLQEHMRIVHSVQPQFPCHLCGATYDSDSKLQKHVKQHEGKAKAKEQQHYVCWLCSTNKNIKPSKYTKRSFLEKHLTGYHRLNKAQIDWSNLKVTNNTQEAESEGEEGLKESDAIDEDEPIKRLKVDGDTEFTCAKCTFVCESREEFLSHIPQHKTEDESHQCQECGMSFMVLPSLKRHLLVVHRIRDFMKYFQESGLNLETPPVEERSKPLTRPKFPVNGTSETKAASDLADDAGPDDFECKVCYKQFDNEKSLHNHMRVHGMAFIRSKRMDI